MPTSNGIVLSQPSRAKTSALTPTSKSTSLAPALVSTPILMAPPVQPPLPQISTETAVEEMHLPVSITEPPLSFSTEPSFQVFKTMGISGNEVPFSPVASELSGLPSNASPSSIPQVISLPGAGSSVASGEQLVQPSIEVDPVSASVTESSPGSPIQPDATLTTSRAEGSPFPDTEFASDIFQNISLDTGATTKNLQPSAPSSLPLTPAIEVVPANQHSDSNSSQQKIAPEGLPSAIATSLISQQEILKHGEASASPADGVASVSSLARKYATALRMAETDLQSASSASSAQTAQPASTTSLAPTPSPAPPMTTDNSSLPVTFSAAVGSSEAQRNLSPTSPTKPSAIAWPQGVSNSATAGKTSEPNSNSETSDPTHKIAATIATAQADSNAPNLWPVATVALAGAAVSHSQAQVAASPARPQATADASANSSGAQTSPPSLGDSPSAPAPGPVQMAQIVKSLAHAEMRVGLNTAAFGSVEVRTVVHANDVGVVIGSERGDLRSLLSNELPGIAHSLQQQDLRLTQVNFHEGFAFSNQHFSGSDAQPRSFARPHSTRTQSPETGSLSNEPAEPASVAIGEGFSILA